MSLYPAQPIEVHLNARMWTSVTWFHAIDGERLMDLVMDDHLPTEVKASRQISHTILGNVAPGLNI